MTYATSLGNSERVTKSSAALSTSVLCGHRKFGGASARSVNNATKSTKRSLRDFLIDAASIQANCNANDTSYSGLNTKHPLNCAFSATETRGAVCYRRVSAPRHNCDEDRDRSSQPVWGKT